ncbi:MAG TPA: protease complex subunit PrcB family protein [Flavobacterium sp.]|jgi:hypothetical protein
MRKLFAIAVIVLALSCGPKTNKTAVKPLYEILTVQNDGGANIQFYEILNEAKEIKMLLNDEHLKRKIKSEDTATANFIILNMGEKPTSGYSITIDSVEETADEVIFKVKEKAPDEGTMSAQVITHPYTIVKVNSKKQIVIK